MRKTYSGEDIRNMENIYRLSLVNSLSGIKPANLIATRSADGVDNVAIFSSVVHLGSNPALLGFVMRPTTVIRHTYDNIKSSGLYTINHLPNHLTAEAHYSSAKFEDGVSEFDACGIEMDEIEGFDVPFVADSPVRIGMRFVQEVPIEVNGTIMMIGRIDYLDIKSSMLADDGSLDLSAGQVAGISGLDSYYSIERIAKYPYARVGQPSKNIL